MNEHTSTSLHSYVISYGMSREPFSDEIEDDLFYAEPTRKQKLDILLHLTQYGNELMLVTGPDDSGKTTLLQQFKAHALDTWKVARIEAKNGIDERKLVQQLFHQMDLEFHGATHAELLEHLEHHFDSLQHSARQAVMLIDDAEHLPVTALKSVLMLSGLTSKDNKPLIRIILLGTDKLNENFTDPLLNQYSNIVRRNIDLPAFDNEQTAHYILHRLSAADYADNKPFTDSAMQKIHKQSHGWPGKINQLAHNLLVESASTAAVKANNNKHSKLTAPKAIAITIGITVISGLLFFQDEFNTWLTNPTDDGAAISQQISKQLPIAPIAESQPNNALADAGTATDTTATESNTPSTAPQLPTADDSTSAPTEMHDEDVANGEDETYADANIPNTPEQTLPITAPALTPAEAPTESPTDTPPTIAKSPETSPTISTNTSPAAPPIIPSDLPGHRADWILKQNPEHFTLQLVAGNDIKTLRAFIKRYPLGKPLAVYRSTRKNQPWFGLIHATFPNKQTAFAARDRLPKRLRRQKPWVRKLGPLQAELRETVPTQ